VDIALEGTSTQGPKPTLSNLQSVFDKVAEIHLKQAKETAKNSTYRGRGRNYPQRGPRGGRGGRHPPINSSLPDKNKSSS
jgi:hypothetical protein